MNFYHGVNFYSWFKKKLNLQFRQICPSGNPVDFYDSLLNREDRYIYEFLAKEKGVFTSQLLSERDYYINHCPYFAIHPLLIDQLSKMRMDIPATLIKFPKHPSYISNDTIRSFLIRFPENTDKLVIDGKHCVRTILVWLSDKDYNSGIAKKFIAIPDLAGCNYKMSIWLDINEFTESLPVWTYKNLYWSENDTIEQAANKLPVSKNMNEGVKISNEIVSNCIRLAVSCCFLMNSNSSLVRPDILSKDESKLTENNIEELHKRAYNSGKYGWKIGYDDLFSQSKSSVVTGKGLKWSHIRTMHWHVVRFGEGKKESRVDLYMDIHVRPDLPLKG